MVHASLTMTESVKIGVPFFGARLLSFFPSDQPIGRGIIGNIYKSL